MRVKFLTKPQDPPSGVSAGQTMPQCELCSCLGFGYLPFLSNGVVTLLKWDKNDANVSLFSTCDTPVFKTLLSLSLPQLPVAKAVLNPLDIVSCRMYFSNSNLPF